MAKDPLIIDKNYEKSLTDLGFCLIPLLDSGQVSQIRSLYEDFLLDDHVSGLIASHSKTTPEQSLRISHSIRDIVMPSLTSAFQGFEFFIAGFMVKEAGDLNEFPVHQDWNIVDESQYSCYQLWIPLSLASPANGGMMVLPGSHLFYGNHRSGSYGIPWVHIDDTIRPMLTDMIIPPGHALVYHNSLFHASYPNHSDLNRVSVIVSIYQKKAPLQYFHKEQDRTDIYDIDPTVFLSSLSVLEQGGLPIQPLGKISGPLDKIDNSKIISAGLAEKFRAHFDTNQKGFEPLQLHILKDESLQEKLFRDGYAVADFIDLQTVKEMKDEYYKLFSSPHTDIGRFTPMEHTTPEMKRRIHDFITDRTKTALDRFFQDYRTPISSYFTKYAMSEGNLTLHNDTSLLLNTNLEPHYGIWCPLVDVNENNGALCVIERSHKFGHAPFLNGLQWPYTHYLQELNAKKKVLNLKAGQMVLFDLRLIHDGNPNNTNEDRVCFAIRLTHLRSQYYSFKRENENTEAVSVFAERDDYYLRDEWTDDNQMNMADSKIGELQDIYARIDHKNISSILAEQQQNEKQLQY